MFNPATPPALSVRDLAQQLIEEKRQDAEINGLARKATDKHRASLALVVEILGGDTAITAVDYDRCKHVQLTLSQLPPNRSQTYRGLNVEEVIQQAKEDGVAPMSPLTQQPHLTTLKDLLNLAVNKGAIAHNHAQNLKPLKRDSVAADKKRVPFSLEQIERFFRPNSIAIAGATDRSHIARPTRTGDFGCRRSASSWVCGQTKHASCTRTTFAKHQKASPTLTWLN